MTKRIELIERLLDIVENKPLTERELIAINAVAEEILNQLGTDLAKQLKGVA